MGLAILGLLLIADSLCCGLCRVASSCRYIMMLSKQKLILSLLLRWWKKADEADSCKTSTKTSELHPKQLFGVFLLLVVAMVLALVVGAIQLCVDHVKRQASI